MIDEKILMQKLSKYYDKAMDDMKGAENRERREEASYYSGYVDALDNVMNVITLEFMKEQKND